MDTLKHHHIRFTLPDGSSLSQITKPTLESRLKSMPGMHEAQLDLLKGELFVEYDLRKCREEIIEKWLLQEGFMLDNSIVERFKRGFIKFTEENEMDNLKIRTSCCSDSDEIERSKKTFRG